MGFCFNPQLIIWFKFNHYKHCSKCYEKKKCTLGFLCVFYTRQAEADYYGYRCLSPASSVFQPQHSPLPLSVIQSAKTCNPPPHPVGTTARRVRPTRTGFKIDLYIFIYAYIKKKAGKFSQWCVGVRRRSLRHPGPGKEAREVGGGRCRVGGVGGAGEGG